MDQFEEISSKNRRIMRIILGVPLAFAILLVAGLLLCIPYVIKVGGNADLQKEILNQDNMTPGEADEYLTRLTADAGINDMMSEDAIYNASLAKLYTKKGDYDKAIGICLAGLQEEESVFYRYYLAQAYLEKGEYEDAKRELASVLSASGDSFYDSTLYDSTTSALADSVRIKAGTQSQIDLIDLRDVIIAAPDREFTEKEAASYISRFKEKARYAAPLMDDEEFMLSYILVCVQAEDFAEMKRVIPEAIKAKDDPAYRYYMGVAFARTGEDFDKAMEQFDAFFAASDAISEAEKTKEKEITYLSQSAFYKEKADYENFNKTAVRMLDIRTSYASGMWLELMKEFKSVVSDKKPYDSQVLADGDQDGMSDELEKLLGTDPAKKDTDGDGYEDEKEIIFVHNPLVVSDDKLSAQGYYDYYSKMVYYQPSAEDAKAAQEYIIIDGEPTEMMQRILHIDQR